MSVRDALNPLLMTDAYKLDHRRQYPAGTTGVYSNYTNRGSRVPGVDYVVHFGLQAFLRDVLQDSFSRFFAADEDAVAAEYERRVTQVLGPNDIGSDHIRALHQLGYVPLRFAAVPEGTLVPIRVPSFTVENTLPEFFWLVNYVETALSAAIWQPSTSATQAWHLRQLLDQHAAKTGADAASVAFQAHDFSFRGMAGIEAAAASGAGHLLSFTGTDSLTSLDWIDYFYPGSPEGTLIGGSVPATEHSVMCAGGEIGEEDTFRQLLRLYPTGIVSVVSDTWDLWAVLTTIVPRLKDEILGRDGTLVIRPDSGDPVNIVCGDPDADPGSPAFKGVIRLLDEVFGSTVNAAGYRELDPHIGAIYGDSITYDRAQQICERLAAQGYSSTSLVMGVGSFTYQYVTRDTFKSAMKATWARVNGEERNLLKDPVTDDGTKKSATGRLAVLQREDGELYLIERADADTERQSLLQPVWEDGKFLVQQSFQDVRDRLTQESRELAARL